MWVRDRLDGLWHDEDFDAWYPRDGRPRLSPAQLATVSVLQFLLNLSDRQAAEAVRCRIDFKYALALDLDDPGFHHSVLSDFRDRLAQDNRADALLDLALARLREAGLVKARGRQRTDSTYLRAAVRELTRLELMLETVRAAPGGRCPHLPGGPRRPGGRGLGPALRAAGPPGQPAQPSGRPAQPGRQRCRRPPRTRPRPPPGHGAGARDGGAASDHGPALPHRCPGPAASAGREGRSAANRPAPGVALRPRGPLHAPRAPDLGRLSRSCHRDLRRRQHQRHHGRGHHRPHRRQRGPARHPHPAGAPPPAAHRAPRRHRLHLRCTP
ncbi:transposase [Actinacidiphila oryziradicis]|uniref:Transposase n=1 Tax=Actinacidiphila oryziradicis TaxID=2571141 RepID=A0A4V5MXI2_9ACTN|nr:transposase [Actinacidiphila oryziradicis]